MKFIYYPLVLLWLSIFGQVVLWFGQAKYTLYLSQGISELKRKFLALQAKEKTTKLSDCRQELVDKLFKEVLQNEQNKLHKLLPARNTCTLNLRNMRKFKPVFKTNRFCNSFMTFNSLKA